MSVRTLEEVGQLLEQSAAESKRTNELLTGEVMPRLDRIEVASKEAGILNGHASDFKAMVEDYRQGMERSKAWTVVRSDLGRRLTFLSQPKAWLKALFYAMLGGLGWQLVSHAPRSIPFLH